RLWVCHLPCLITIEELMPFKKKAHLFLAGILPAPMADLMFPRDPPTLAYVSKKRKPFIKKRIVFPFTINSVHEKFHQAVTMLEDVRSSTTHWYTVCPFT
ncbi:hypothetical protein KI387_004875, partial [Taxus chinensis]